MKLLILTVSAGDGHNSISRAIKEGMEARGAEVRIYDLFKETSKPKTFIVNRFYFFVSKNFIKISNAFFESFKYRNPAKNTHNIVHVSTRKNVPEVKRVLDDFNPDLVLCAHTFAGSIMGQLISEGIVRAKVISMITDFDVPPFVENSTNVDYLITPNEDFDEILFRKGFTKQQLLPMGIPVSARFSTPIDKKTIRKKLGIEEGAFTVMLMNGGIGFGNTLNLIKEICSIDAKIHVISVSGRNEKLHGDIARLIGQGVSKPILNLGYVGNVDELMSAANCLIGKIGGVAICEAFNKELPIIANTFLPWQEYDNMLYLKARGACDYIPDPGKAKSLVEKYVRNEKLLLEMKEKISGLRKPEAANNVCDFMVTIASGK